jgi:hypothetical protein
MRCSEELKRGYRQEEVESRFRKKAKQNKYKLAEAERALI